MLTSYSIDVRGPPGFLVTQQFQCQNSHLFSSPAESRVEAARQQLEQLETQLDFGSRNLFSARDTYWYLHDAGVDLPEDIDRGFCIDDDDLKELADEHAVGLAAQILPWRKLTRDVRFLETGESSDRVHPVWRMTRTSTGRIVASDPPVQNIDKKKYRPFLIAPPGRTLAKADWKTCQARILAI